MREFQKYIMLSEAKFCDVHKNEVIGNEELKDWDERTNSVFEKGIALALFMLFMMAAVAILLIK